MKEPVFLMNPGSLGLFFKQFCHWFINISLMPTRMCIISYYCKLFARNNTIKIEFHLKIVFFYWRLHGLGLLPIGLAIPSSLCFNMFKRPGGGHWFLYKYCCHSLIHEVIKSLASSPGFITPANQKWYDMLHRLRTFLISKNI